MIQVGGLEAFEMDYEIPLKYGVDQCIGDSLGPGGVFRGLRTIPVLVDIAGTWRSSARGAAAQLRQPDGARAAWRSGRVASTSSSSGCATACRRRWT